MLKFINVCKRYNLGLTRSSLPLVISQWVKQSFSHSSRESVGKKYLWAVKDVSFGLNKGQSLALVGPNGAGKSTILKLLAKITHPTQGKIEVNGKLSALIELGAGFHPDLTGKENVFLNGTILGLKRSDIEQHYDEIVSFAELEDFMDTPIKRYSSGMTVRLGFAVASCIEPDILLIDEVLAVGDASFREKCIKRIKELLNAGTSLIFVSHSMELVKSVCEKALYIDNGQVQLAGDSSEVIDAYNRVLDRQRAMKLNKISDGMTGSDLDIEITRIEVGDGNHFNNPVSSTDNLEIRIHYHAFNSPGKSNVIVRIYRSDGLSCCVMHTYFDHFDLTLEKGQGVVSIKLNPLQLFGGMYHAIAWIMDADNINGITRGSSDWFMVKNVEAGREDQDAVYEPIRQWFHKIS